MRTAPDCEGRACFLLQACGRLARTGHQTPALTFRHGIFHIFERNVMNKDQVKGRLKEAAGEIQEQAGKVGGNKPQEAKGHAREMHGKVQKNAGDMKEDVKDAAKR